MIASHKLKTHNVLTETFNRYECKDCNFKHIMKSALDLHVINYHSEEGKEERICKVCSKVFLRSDHQLNSFQFALREKSKFFCLRGEGG